LNDILCYLVIVFQAIRWCLFLTQLSYKSVTIIH